MVVVLVLAVLVIAAKRFFAEEGLEIPDVVFVIREDTRALQHVPLAVEKAEVDGQVQQSDVMVHTSVKLFCLKFVLGSELLYQVIIKCAHARAADEHQVCKIATLNGLG